MTENKKVTISAFDFWQSKWFLSRSPGGEPAFIKVDKQMYQNMKCQVSGETFRKLHEEYTKWINKPNKK